jgi:hypothetical protein
MAQSYGVTWYKASDQNHLYYPCDNGLWFGHTTTSCGSHVTCHHANCHHGPATTMEVHVTSSTSLHHMASTCGLHVMTSCTIKYPKFPKFQIFSKFSKMHNFKIFTRVAMEPKIKLANGQFRPGAYQIDLCTQTSTLLCRILNQFHCRNWGFFQFHPILHGYTVISRIRPITGPTHAYLEIKIGDFNP